MLSIKNNFPAIALQLKRMRKDIGDKALRSTVNKVAAISKTAMNKEIRSEFVMKAGEVGKELKVDRARAGRRARGIVAKLSARPGKRSINLIRFLEKKVSFAQARRRRKEGSLNVLRFKIKKSGGFKTIKGAFIGNKGRTVFQREGRGRLPIKAAQTIGVAQMFNTKKINRVVVRNAQLRLAKIFDNEARFFTAKFNAR